MGQRWLSEWLLKMRDRSQPVDLDNICQLLVVFNALDLLHGLLLLSRLAPLQMLLLDHALSHPQFLQILGICGFD